MVKGKINGDVVEFFYFLFSLDYGKHKIMPRKARLDAPGALHHIIARCIPELSLFRDDQDRLLLLSRLKRLCGETKMRILAWAFMDNHFHLLLFSIPPGISKFMRRLLTSYSLYYNRKYSRSGHLFQNRFKSIICDKKEYLLELIRYIHLNPWRASIVKSIEELNSYPWCGHKYLIGKEKNDWQEVDYVLAQFADKKKKAIKIYLKFLEEGKDQGKRDDLEGNSSTRKKEIRSHVRPRRERKDQIDHRILGGEDFLAEVLKEADKKLKREISWKKEHIKQVIQKFCRGEEIKEEEVRRGSRRRQVAAVRAKIAFYLSHEMNVPFAEIARHVGVCTSAVAKAVQALERNK